MSIINAQNRFPVKKKPIDEQISDLRWLQLEKAAREMNVRITKNIALLRQARGSTNEST